MTCELRSLRWPHVVLWVLVAITAVALFASLAIASTDPVKDTRQIMAGTVTTTKVKNEYLSGARDSSSVFRGALSAYKAMRAAEVPVPAPTPVPAPVPTTAAAYDASIGMGVTPEGFAILPLRAGAHRYFVNSATGSDSNDCTAALKPATPRKTIAGGFLCVVNSYEGGNVGDHVLLAEGTRYDEPLPWLAFEGGFSAQYPTVLQSYDPADPLNESKYGRGDQRGARPVITKQVGSAGNGIYSFLAVRGLDFNPGNVPDVGLQFVGQANYLLIENNLFRYTGLSIDSADKPNAQHHVIRGNSLYGQWSKGGRTGGVYDAGVDGVTLEDNVFWHCGWKVGAGRTDDMTLGGATVFSHSYYIQTNTTAAIVRRNLSVDGAGDGGIARGDSVFSENLFIDNPAAIGLGGGPQYNLDRPTGVLFQASYNAIIGSSSVPNGASGWAINTTNGKPGSRVHHNLIVRSANPLDPNGSGFSNNAAFNQPSYAQFDHNLIWRWIDKSLQPHSAWESCGLFPAQCFTTYDFNNWDGTALGTNTNSAGTVFPNPYTLPQLVSALGFASKDAWMVWAIEHPELKPARRPRELLFQGYAVPR